MTNYSLALSFPAKVNHNTCDAELIELAVAEREGLFASTGAFTVETGVHTGRSVQDKFTVRDATTDKVVWWDNNKPMSPEAFDLLWADFQQHIKTRRLYVQDLYAGADPSHRLNARIFTELAWHALFIRNLLRKPKAGELASFKPEFTVINLPSFKADPKRHGVRSETVIACNFAKRLVLIGGTSYAGETKKSVFTYLNFVMPDKGVMPMHCSANVGPRATPPSSSACPAPARPRSRPTPSERSWATTSTAGRGTASSISRAAATPRPSASPPRPSLRSGPPPTASARCWRT